MNDGEILEIPVGEIGPGPLVRSERIDLDHVALLRDHLDDLPPVLIRQTGKGWSLVDGQHRLSAHREEGRTTVRAVVVALDDAEALEAAIEANVTHGKPLTIGERKAAARRLIAETQYANPRIAAICGIGERTVAALRPHPTPQNDAVGRTAGADGKARPASKAEQKAQREAIAAVLAEHPDLSLASVAERVGCSPMTVASVRTELKTSGQQDPPPSAAPAAPTPLAAVPQTDTTETVADLADPCPVPGEWQKHKAMLRTNATREAAQLLDRRLIRDGEDEPALVADAIPAELSTAAARVARDCARFWNDLADRLSHPTHLSAVEER